MAARKAYKLHQNEDDNNNLRAFQIGGRSNRAVDAERTSGALQSVYLK